MRGRRSSCPTWRANLGIGIAGVGLAWLVLATPGTTCAVADEPTAQSERPVPTWTLRDGSKIAGRPLQRIDNDFLLDRPDRGLIRVAESLFSEDDTADILEAIVTQGDSAVLSPEELERRFAALIDPAPTTITSVGHLGPVGGSRAPFAISADGQRLAVIFDDGRIEVWTTNPLQPLTRLPRTASAPDACQVALSGDGRIVFVAEDSKAWFLDVESGRAIREMDDLPADLVQTVPDGSAVIVRSGDSVERITFTDGTRERLTFEGLGDVTLGLSVPDGRLCMIGEPHGSPKLAAPKADAPPSDPEVDPREGRGYSWLRFTSPADERLRSNSGLPAADIVTVGRRFAMFCRNGEVLGPHAIHRYIEHYAGPDRPTSMIGDDMRYQAVGSRIRRFLGAASSLDDRYVAVIGDKRLEVRRWDTLLSTVELALPEPISTGPVLFSSDLRLVAVRNGRTMLLWRIDGPLDTPSGRILGALTDWLYRFEFDTIDTFIAWAENHAAEFERFYTGPVGETLVDALSNPNDGWTRRALPLEEALRLWVTLSPHSDWARISLSRRLNQQGWNARGNGFGYSVTEEGWETLRKLAIEATEVLQPVLDRDDPPLEAIVQAILNLRSTGNDCETVKTLAGRARRRDPSYFPVHRAAMFSLLPRWGGSFEEIKTYITTVTDEVKTRQGERASDAIYGRLYFQLNRFEKDEVSEKECGRDNARFVRGVAAALQSGWDVQNATFLSDLAHVMLLCERNEDHESGKAILRYFENRGDHWPANMAEQTKVWLMDGRYPKKLRAMSLAERWNDTDAVHPFELAYAPAATLEETQGKTLTHMTGSLDGERVAALVDGAEAVVWDVRSGQRIARFELPALPGDPRTEPQEQRLALDRRGGLVAILAADRATILVGDATSGSVAISVNRAGFEDRRLIRMQIIDSGELVIADDHAIHVVPTHGERRGEVIGPYLPPKASQGFALAAFSAFTERIAAHLVMTDNSAGSIYLDPTPGKTSPAKPLRLIMGRGITRPDLTDRVIAAELRDDHQMRFSLTWDKVNEPVEVPTRFPAFVSSSKNPKIGRRTKEGDYPFYRPVTDVAIPMPARMPGDPAPVWTIGRDPNLFAVAGQHTIDFRSWKHLDRPVSIATPSEGNVFLTTELNALMPTATGWTVHTPSPELFQILRR